MFAKRVIGNGLAKATKATELPLPGLDDPRGLAQRLCYSEQPRLLLDDLPRDVTELLMVETGGQSGDRLPFEMARRDVWPSGERGSVNRTVVFSPRRSVSSLFRPCRAAASTLSRSCNAVGYCGHYSFNALPRAQTCTSIGRGQLQLTISQQCHSNHLHIIFPYCGLSAISFR